MSDSNPWSQSGSHDACDFTIPQAPPMLPPASQSLSQNDLHPSVQRQQTPMINIVAQTEAPPSYDTVVTDHLKDPPGQHRQDIKKGIPDESVSSSYYRSEGSISSDDSEAGPSVPHFASQYAAICRPISASNGIMHSPTSAEEQSLGLTGQIALGPDDDDEGDDSDRSYWSIAGEPRAWAALAYMFIILPFWTVFCFTWTLTFALSSMVAMIFPPFGYLFTIFSVTSWRALARADLVLASALVSDKVRQRYPIIAADVYVAPEPGPIWKSPRVFGNELPLPEFVQHKLQRRHTSKSRRPKNICHRAAKHLRATLNRHSISSMFYFLLWKMMFGIPVWIAVVLMFSITVPLVICLLPALLITSKGFANWQYRWAVTWLSEKADAKSCLVL